MAWIELPGDDATPELTRTLRQFGGRRVPSIVAIMKPAPQTLRAVLKMNQAVTFGGSSLGRRREELIATAVSALNDCFY
jgi:alkylhydroperoxidase family enzyme